MPPKLMGYWQNDLARENKLLHQQKHDEAKTVFHLNEAPNKLLFSHPFQLRVLPIAPFFLSRLDYQDRALEQAMLKKQRQPSIKASFLQTHLVFLMRQSTVF